MAHCDVVIPAFSKTEALVNMLDNAITSILASDPSYDFNIIIVEQDLEISWEHRGCTTIRPNMPWGYHKSLNQGATYGTAPLIAFCNSDLVFFPNWFANLKAVFDRETDLVSASPAEPGLTMAFNLLPERMPEGEHLYDLRYDYTVRDFLLGWILVLKRDFWQAEQPFDERYIGWYSDDDYAMVLSNGGFKHACIKSSGVQHLVTATANLGDVWTACGAQDGAAYMAKWGHEQAFYPEEGTRNIHQWNSERTPKTYSAYVRNNDTGVIELKQFN